MCPFTSIALFLQEFLFSLSVYQEAVDWVEGDNIVIAPTGKDGNETEVSVYIHKALYLRPNGISTHTSCAFHMSVLKCIFLRVLNIHLCV